MSRPPVCRAREALAALRRAPNPITVPMHSGDLKSGTLRRIIRDAGLTIDEFRRLL